MVKKLLQFIVVPPRLYNVMIGKDGSIVPSKKPGAENINLELRSGAANVELSHSLIVHLQFARCVYRQPNRASRFFVHKPHHDVHLAGHRRLGRSRR